MLACVLEITMVSLAEIGSVRFESHPFATTTICPPATSRPPQTTTYEGLIGPW
jgi:hypothetical protein